MSYLKPKTKFPYRGKARARKIKSFARQLRAVKKDLSLVKASTLRQQFVNNAAATVTQAGIFTLLNGMQTGDGDNQRNGNSIVIKRIECRCHVYLDSAALPTAAAHVFNYRMMLIWDTQPDNTIISIADVLANSGSNANNHLSPTDINNVNKGTVKGARFRILFDKSYSFVPSANTRGAVGTTSYETAGKLIVVRKNYKAGLLTKYDNSNAGTIADINTGSLYMYETCNQNTNLVSANRCQILYYE